MSEMVLMSFGFTVRIAKFNPSDAGVRILGLDGLDKKKKGFTIGGAKIAVLN